MSTTVSVRGRQGSVAEPARISSIDIVRGSVMVLMAIDHVRVYSGLPAGGPTAGIFFTRWVTHFARRRSFSGRHGRVHVRTAASDARALPGDARPLAVLLELTMLRVDVQRGFGGYNMAGVIWVIGWCMVALALLTRLPLAAIGHSASLSSPDTTCSISYQARLDTGRAVCRAVGNLYLGPSAGPIALGNDGPQLWCCIQSCRGSV
jgi:hypothetical protein